jgi:prevent-host-death family protein
MNSVNIADLKNQLSTYLNRVRAGEEIVIKDRNLPIAKIVPLSLADDAEAEELALIASGQMLPPRVKKLPESFWKMGGPRLSIAKAAQAVSRDREGR